MTVARHTVGATDPGLANARAPLPDLQRLERFVAVVDAKRVTDAALELDITQQALSASIRQLEREMRTELFTRARGRLVPTEAGIELYRVTLPLLANARETFSAVHASGRTVPITVGCPNGVGEGDVLSFLSAALADDETAAVRMHSVDGDAVAGELLQGAVDVVITVGTDLGSVRHRDLTSAQLPPMPLSVAVPPGVTRRTQTTVSLRALSGLAVVLPAVDVGSGFTNYVEASWRAVGLVPDLRVNRVPGTWLGVQLGVSAGHCVPVIGRAPAELDHDVLTVVDAPPVPAQATWCPARRSARRDHLIERLLVGERTFDDLSS